MKFKLTFLFLFLSREGLAACGYTLSLPALSYTVSSSNVTTAYSLNLSRNNNGSSSCNNFMVGFSKGGANNYNRVATNIITGSTLSYNLYKYSNSSSSLKTINDANSNSEILTGTVAKNANTSLNYHFRLGTLNGSSLTRGGLYQDTITVAVNSGNLSFDRGPEVSQVLSVNITVPKEASLSMVNSGEPYNSSSTNKTLDFGELSLGEEMNFDVILLSNAGYSLSLSSANNEVLQLVGAGATSNTQIAYDLYAGGVQRTLTGSANAPVVISTGSGVTSTQGTRIPVRVVISSVTDKVAGTYQDYVTFTIATTE